MVYATSGFSRNSEITDPELVGEFNSLVLQCIDSVYHDESLTVSDIYGEIGCVNFITKVNKFNPTMMFDDIRTTGEFIRESLLLPQCNNDDGNVVTCIQKIVDDPSVAYDVIDNPMIFPHSERVFTLGDTYVSGIEYVFHHLVNIPHGDGGETGDGDVYTYPIVQLYSDGIRVRQDERDNVTAIERVSPDDYQRVQESLNYYFSHSEEDSIESLIRAYVIPLQRYEDLFNAKYCNDESGRPITCLNKVLDSDMWDLVMRQLSDTRRSAFDPISVTNFHQPCLRGDGVAIPCVEKIFDEQKFIPFITSSYGLNLAATECNDINVPGLRVSCIERVIQDVEDAYREYKSVVNSHGDDFTLEKAIASAREIFNEREEMFMEAIDGAVYDLSTVECRDEQHRPISCIERLFQFVERYTDFDKDGGQLSDPIHHIMLYDARIILNTISEQKIHNLASVCVDGEQPTSCMERYIDNTFMFYRNYQNYGRFFAEQKVESLTGRSEVESESDSQDHSGDDDVIGGPFIDVGIVRRDLLAEYEQRLKEIIPRIFQRNLDPRICRDPVNGDLISCYEYVINRNDIDDIVRPDDIIFMILKSKNVMQLNEPTRTNVLQFIQTHAEQIHPDRIHELGEDVDIGDEYTAGVSMMNIGRQVCGIHDENSVEYRQCFDKICLRVMGSMSESETFTTPQLRAGATDHHRQVVDRTWMNEWARSFIEEPLGHEYEYDNAWLYTNHEDVYHLCGTWDVVAKADGEFDDYVNGIMLYIDTFNELAKSIDETYKGRSVHLQIELASRIDNSLQFVVKYIDNETGKVNTGRPQRFGKIAKIINKYSPSLHSKIQASLTRKPTGKSRGYTMVISRRPVDFIRSSTCQNWMSCFNVKNGIHMNTIPDYFENGVYLAYLADAEWSPQWYTRMFLVPMKDKVTGEVVGFSVQDVDVYGIESLQSVLSDALKMVLYEAGYRADIAPQVSMRQVSSFNDYSRLDYIPSFLPSLADLDAIDIGGVGGLGEFVTSGDDDDDDDGGIIAADDESVDGDMNIGKFLWYKRMKLHDPDAWVDTMQVTNVTDAIYRGICEKRGNEFLVPR
jgi:hypothetical protein